MIVKQGDTKMIVTDTPTINGVPMTPPQLVGCTVYFVAQSFDGVTVMRNAGTISTDANGNGQFNYQFVAADVAGPGKFHMEWDLIFPGGQSLTFPNSDYNVLNIKPELG